MVPILESPAPELIESGFSVSHQKLDLDLDLLSRRLKGRTEITLNPLAANSKLIRLNLRQCKIEYLQVNGKPSSLMEYEDCYKRAQLPYRAGVHQYHMVLDRLQLLHKDKPQPELTVGLPKNFKIEELDPYSEETQSLLLAKSLGSNKRGSDTTAAELAQGPAISIDSTAKFAPINLYIEFSIDRIRDGMQFVGLEEGDLRYPHAYSLNSPGAEGSRCLFPCADHVNTRCTWEISIKTARTIGDIFKNASRDSKINGVSRTINRHGGQKGSIEDVGASFSAEDKAMELVVLSSGEVTDEVKETCL